MKTIMNKLALLAAAVIFTLNIALAPAAGADPIRADLAIGSHWLYADSAGYDKVDENNWFRSNGFALRYFFYGPFSAGYSYFANDTRNTDSARLYRSTFMLDEHLIDLGAHYPLCDYFEMYIALNAVKYFAEYDIEPSVNPGTYVDNAWGFGGKIGADLMLPTPRRDAAIGVYAEAGYTSEVEFGFGRTGDLSVGGPTLALGVRFHLLDAGKMFGNRQPEPRIPTVTAPVPAGRGADNFSYPDDPTAPTE